MGKIMSFIMLVMTGLMQISADAMLVSTFVQNGCEVHDYIVAMGLLVAASIFLVVNSYKEWRKECEQ